MLRLPAAAAFAVAALSLVACANHAGTSVRTVASDSPAPRLSAGSQSPSPSTRGANARARNTSAPVPTAHTAPASVATSQRPVASPQRPPKRAPAASAAAASAPEILSISVSPSVVGSGSVVHASVRTTPNVVSVTAYAAGQSIDVPRVGSGAFAGSTTLPALPPFVHGSFGVTFRAYDARGAMTQAATAVTVP